jgi:hypothetical protein
MPASIAQNARQGVGHVERILCLYGDQAIYCCTGRYENQLFIADPRATTGYDIALVKITRSIIPDPDSLTKPVMVGLEAHSALHTDAVVAWLHLLTMPMRAIPVLGYIQDASIL